MGRRIARALMLGGGAAFLLAGLLAALGVGVPGGVFFAALGAAIGGFALRDEIQSGEAAASESSGGSEGGSDGGDSGGGK
jgi:hypothetical protein